MRMLGMTAKDLQTAIAELAALDYKPDTAGWVSKVSSAPTAVVAGAIVLWVAGGGPSSLNGDPMAPRREAATAILQARFSAESARQTKWLLRLTWVIAILTAVMLYAVFVPLLAPIPTHAELISMPPPK
jgi:hypothetical protein